MAQKIGQWEKHTKGIGSKLMKAMGYKEGEGLGPEGRKGITKPLESKVRTSRGGLGFSETDKLSAQERAQSELIAGKRERTKDRDEDIYVDDISSNFQKKTSDEEQDDDEEMQWRKTTKRKKQKTIKSIDEIRETLQKGQQKQMIIDMTGETQRVVTDLSTLSQQNQSNDPFQSSELDRVQLLVPELYRNLLTLVDLAEIGIQNADKKINVENEKLLSLKSQKSRIETQLTLNKTQKQGLSNIIILLEDAENSLEKLKSIDLNNNNNDNSRDNMKNKNKKGDIMISNSCKIVSELLLKVQNQYADLYYSYNIPLLAHSILSPIVSIHSIHPFHPPIPSTHSIHPFHPSISIHFHPFPSISIHFHPFPSISSIIISILTLFHKQLQMQYKNWKPLEEYEYGIESFTILKEILLSNSPIDFGGEGEEEGMGFMVGDPITHQRELKRYINTPSVDSLLQLQIDCLLPSLRSNLTQWDGKEPSSCIRFFKRWKDILLPSIRDHLLTHIIFPKLEYQVNLWDPLTDNIPIHIWIHPWRLFFHHKKLSQLYPTIRHRLSSALSNWYPSDPSALAMISPWKNVFDEESLNRILIQQILPKLEMSLNEFRFEPSNQNINLESISWVFAWKDLIPRHKYLLIWEQSFFPKWHNVLWLWLTAHSNPDYNEIADWYLGWKSVFPLDFFEEDRIKRQFRHGLELIDKVLSSTGSSDSTDQQQPPPPPPMSAPPPPPPPSSPPRLSGNDELSLTEALEHFASKNNITFLPTLKRTPNGKKIFSFGRLSVVADGNMIYFLENNKKWSPITLEKLLQKASS